MDASSPLSLTVRGAARALRAGDLSSTELVRAVLDAASTRGRELNAYVHLDPEAALAQAGAADEALAAKAPGSLLGVPIAVKDNIGVLGQPCGCCSRILEGYRSPYDATVTAKFRGQGAIFTGRTNMDEFAMGSSSESSCHGPTVNPAMPGYVPGGSSSGSAAAVAGGAALAALGSDTGGSIRQPASFCGCVGLKPSYGRVSRYGVAACASSFDQVGPLAKDVKDAALLLGAMAGADWHDATALDREVPDYLALLENGPRDLKGLKLGLPKEYFGDGVDPEVAAAVRAAAGTCAGLGAEVVEISLPHTGYAVAAYSVLSSAEASANLARFDGVRYGRRAADAESPAELYARTRSEFFGDEVKRRIILGTHVLSSGCYDAYYLRAQKVRTLIRGDFEDAFRACDAILTPVSPTPAWPLGGRTDDLVKAYRANIFTAAANLAGLCGLSVPCGKTEAGLPVGLQILGPAFGEPAILRVADAYEEASR
jgi:aspartyl-tRNA(Asn)/glutamyl-tRNA(Gln) amidotransferase subunit A